MPSQERPDCRALLTREGCFIRCTSTRQPRLTTREGGKSRLLKTVERARSLVYSAGQFAWTGARARDHFHGMTREALRRQPSLRKTRETHAELMEIWSVIPIKSAGNDADA